MNKGQRKEEGRSQLVVKGEEERDVRMKKEERMKKR